jgi:hypothetical protein
VRRAVAKRAASDEEPRAERVVMGAASGGHSSSSTIAMRSPIHFMQGTAIEFPSAR